MNNTMWKRVMVLLMAMVMLASCLMGCNGDGGDNKTESPDGKKTVSFVAVEDTDLSSLLKELAEEGINETTQDNRWTRLFEETLNIDITFNWVANGWDQKRERLGLSLADPKSLPDVISFDDLGMALDAYKGGLTMDLKEAFDLYASDLVKEFFNTIDGQALMAQATVDGELVALPGIASSTVQCPILYVRKDWRESLNIEPVDSREDILNLIKAFAENIDGAYGFGMNGNMSQYVGKLDGFTAMYGSLAQAWYEVDGEIVYGGIQDETYDALMELRAMCLKEGRYNDASANYLSPEWISKSETTLNEDIKNGKVGVVIAPVWLPWNAIQENIKLDPNAEWECYTLFDEDGIATVNADVYARSYIGVNKTLDDPKLFFDMVNLYFEKMWGETKEPLYYGGDSNHDNFWHLSPIQFLNPLGDVYEYDNYMGVINDTVGVEEVANADYIKELHNKFQAGAEMNANEKVSWFMYGFDGTASVLKEYRENDKLLTSWKYVLTSRTTFGSIQDTTFVSIITDPDVDTEALWDHFVTTWTEKGGQKLLEEYNDWYDGVSK
ncbi:MAG: hypothetical protein IJA58_07110 [Lachnospiraceae bacterium]|nr:hypothetical protein [Lachnospiraceae bacterium]